MKLKKIAKLSGSGKRAEKTEITGQGKHDFNKVQGL